ncbi:MULTISPECIES: enoyl-CoA hydratase-related protein [Mycolicibacter]|uniref:enoyl-CoA hydratase-related protein n=1 Tax=Mycolicibacter TaxID=1073531 RepID=UPI00197B40B3|nr:enoyl-CoA hydratase-related protein [Mycolicibacter senuensis]
MTSNVLVTQDVIDGVAIVTWNRPERNNAWSIPMEVEYFRLLTEAAANPDIRVIVVTGAGKSFCPGMDSHTLAEQRNGESMTEPHLRQPMTLPRSIPKPIIAAINGACAGLGLVAAMNCDLRFASSAAKITTSFAHRGIMAEHGLAWSLPRVTGTSKALDLLFSARVVRGEEALSLGIVDRIFEPEELMDKTLEYARDLAAHSSPTAMGIMKRQVYQAEGGTYEDARTLAIRYWLDVLRDHGDFKEGVSSFLEKRAPAFAPWDPSTTSEPAPLPTD